MFSCKLSSSSFDLFSFVVEAEDPSLSPGFVVFLLDAVLDLHRGAFTHAICTCIAGLQMTLCRGFSCRMYGSLQEGLLK